MKKLIALLLALVMVFALGACSAKGNETPSQTQNQANTGSDLKIGVILLHDESIGYDFAHLQGIQTACKNLGIDEAKQVVWKYNIPEDQACYEAAVDLIEQGCTVIISDSYGHQSYMTRLRKRIPTSLSSSPPAILRLWTIARIHTTSSLTPTRAVMFLA